MKAEIISTGNELITGSVVDTNTAFIADLLNSRGVAVNRSTAVGDDKEALAELFTEVSIRADLVLVTGGLGPTVDDLTAQAASFAGGSPLELNREALDTVKRFFNKRGIPMPEGNKKQAMLPSSASVIQNSLGTAPGFSMDINRARFYFMPGVPSEMRRMLEHSVLDDIGSRFDCGKRPAAVVTLFGVPESEADTMLKGLEEKFEGVELGFRADFPVIEVKLACSTDAGDDVLQRAKEHVVSVFGAKTVSETGRSMEEEVACSLIESGTTLAVAESCTGGLVSDMLTDVAGSSAFFLTSCVTYSNEAKIGILGVDRETIAEYGAVHEQTAQEMAGRAREIADADYGISTSGIAGPSGGSPEKPVGTVCIGLARRSGSTAGRFCIDFSDRRKNKRMFAHLALNMLRKELAGLS